MFILLGEKIVAQSVSKYLKEHRIKYEYTRNWVEKDYFHKPAAVLDVSHPSNNTQNAAISRWCEQQNIPYLKLERPETKIPDSPLIFPTYTWEETLARLQDRVDQMSQDKNRPVTVFVTTGSHQLEELVHSSFAPSVRFVVRILPEGRLVQKCKDLGIPSKDIIAMQGPFSREINKALFKFYGADILLTRDSGLVGGTDTKISAAMQLGLEIVLIKKSQTGNALTVATVEELISWVERLT